MKRKTKEQKRDDDAGDDDGDDDDETESASDELQLPPRKTRKLSRGKRKETRANEGERAVTKNDDKLKKKEKLSTARKRQNPIVPVQKLRKKSKIDTISISSSD